MLKPMDIHNMEFKRAWRGYDPEQVDEFTSRVFTEYEAVCRQNDELRENIEELKARIGEYGRLEGSIQDAIDLAKRTSKETKESARAEVESMLSAARREADSIIAEARIEGERVAAEARAQVAQEKDQLRRLQRQQEELYRRMRTVISDVADSLRSIHSEYSQHESPQEKTEDNLSTQEFALLRQGTEG